MVSQVELRNKLTFRIAPLLEVALSLLVVLNPERFEPVDSWVGRVAARIPPGELKELHCIASETDLLGVACELDADERSAAVALDNLAQQDPGIGQPLLAYWTVFAPELAASSGILGDSIQSESGRLRETNPLTFISDFSDRVNVSDDGKALIMEWGRGMRVAFDQLRRIEFIPSIFCRRRMMFYRHRDTQILFYNPNDRSRTAIYEPPESLVLGFSALSDGTRLNLLRLIARENLPAQEMARRLGVHESTISRHLKFLLEAGLVARDRQESKYVYYTLNLNRLDTLVVLLRGYLE